MMKYIKENYKDTNIELKYSTPSEYVQALKQKNQI